MPSLDNDFVNRDDPAYVTNNLAIRGCTDAHLAKIVSSTYVSHYLPVTMLSYMAEYSLFGLNPGAYHRTNLLLHIINSLLVFIILFKLVRNHPAALVAALLFAVHPLRVEAVAWVAERKELLSACFYLISLLIYLSYRKHGQQLFYFLCMGSFIVSLLSKTMSMSLPAVLLLLDYLNDGKITRKAVVEKLPFVALSVVFAAVAYVAAQGAMTSYAGYSIVQRVLMPCYALMFYCVKTIIPLNLCASYYMPPVFDANMNFALWASAGGVTAITAAIIYCRRFSGKIIVGSLFFLVTLLPVLQIINSGGLVLVADRYTYVPVIGLCYLVAVGLAYLNSIRLNKKRMVSAIVYTTIIAVVGVLSVLTWQRCGVWKNSLTLWNSIAEHEPDVPQAFDGRGGALRDAGQYYAAIADFSREIDLKPDAPAGYFGRGYTLCACLGQPQQALPDLREATRLAPGAADAWNTLGIAGAMTGSCDSSLVCFNRAIQLKADFAEAYVNRGYAWMNCFKQFDRAQEDFSKALELDPHFQRAWLLRGIAGSMSNNHATSVTDLSRAIELDSRSAEAYYYRGLEYCSLGQTDRALNDLSNAIAINRGYEDAYKQRGKVFALQGEYSKAISDFNAAMYLAPNDTEAQMNRASASAKMLQENSPRN
jgi:tetratricopeptide (TPR) repeat protein